ncbi:hypothetical protein [Psychromonas sp. MB-3u-54]|uniref:hypothetical protein n=1 Tax=Psychromonas sp. MB-3u-54 TaxID=2058319 RepID=UPI0012FEC188|nr:hypothetical protein [Psychromonas sp. MB-3u-54]
MDVTTDKKWLIEIGQPIVDLDDQYLNALRSTQQANGLGDDGIFGYRAICLLNHYARGLMTTKHNTSFQQKQSLMKGWTVNVFQLNSALYSRL